MLLGTCIYNWCINSPLVGPSKENFVRQTAENYVTSKRTTSFGPIRRLIHLCIAGYAHMQGLTSRAFPHLSEERSVDTLIGFRSCLQGCSAWDRRLCGRCGRAACTCRLTASSCSPRWTPTACFGLSGRTARSTSDTCWKTGLYYIMSSYCRNLILWYNCIFTVPYKCIKTYITLNANKYLSKI